MGDAQLHPDRQDTSGGQVLHLLFEGDAVSVRSALKTARAAFCDMQLGDTLSGVAEIALAEVLNNVVEHAYADRGPGCVEVVIERIGSTLCFQIHDDGVPMPEDDAPSGQAQDLDVSTEDLPEGGFGWFLIRELTEDLRYQRIGDRNALTFRILLDATGPNA